MKTAIYNNQSFTFPDGTSNDAVKEALKTMFPELVNSTYREVNGAVEFYVVAQNKSSASAIYNNQTFTFPDGTTVEAMKEALKTMFPELSNSTYRQVSGAVEFYVVAQNKSSASAIYNNQTFTFPDGTTVEAMKEALKTMFPELSNSTYRQVSGAVEFYVVAQNKSLCA